MKEIKLSDNFDGHEQMIYLATKHNDLYKLTFDGNEWFFDNLNCTSELYRISPGLFAVIGLWLCE